MKNRNVEDTLWECKYWDEKGQTYELVFGHLGMSMDEVLSLIEVLGIESKTGIDTEGIQSIESDDELIRFKRMLQKADEYMKANVGIGRLFTKAALYREVESDELYRLLEGYYVACSLSILCIVR